MVTEVFYDSVPSSWLLAELTSKPRQEWQLHCDRWMPLSSGLFFPKEPLEANFIDSGWVRDSSIQIFLKKNSLNHAVLADPLIEFPWSAWFVFFIPWPPWGLKNGPGKRRLATIRCGSWPGCCALAKPGPKQESKRLGIPCRPQNSQAQVSLGMELWCSRSLIWSTSSNLWILWAFPSQFLLAQMYEPVALNTEVNTLVEFGLLEEPVQSVFAWFLVHAKVYLFCDVFFASKLGNSPQLLCSHWPGSFAWFFSGFHAGLSIPRFLGRGIFKKSKCLLYANLPQ